MRISLGKKLVLLLVVFVVLMSGVAIAFGYHVVDRMNDEHYMRKANEISGTVASVVDVGDLVSVRDKALAVYASTEDKVGSEEWGTPEFDAYVARYASIEKTPEFQRLMDGLRRLQEPNDVSCLYLSVLIPEDGLLMYLVDAAEEDPCPIGCLDPVYEVNYAVLEDPAVGFPAYITDTPEYGWLVTSGTPMYEEGGGVAGYAFVDISMDAIKQQEQQYVVLLTGGLLVLTVLLSAVGIYYVHRFVVEPLNTLSEAATRYCDPDKSERSSFGSIDIHTKDEIESLYLSMVQMEHDIDSYIDNLVLTRAKLKDTRLEADRMSDLARKDSLTGVRNRLAYDQEVLRVEHDIAAGDTSFGIAVVDLNNLKQINDRYGHDHGNVAIRGCCQLVCNVFKNSQVFRIGGDEFVVILEGDDCEHAGELVDSFYRQAAAREGEPWQRFSAAVGYALYDPEVDADVEGVFVRADKEMYRRKREMKVLDSRG